MTTPFERLLDRIPFMDKEMLALRQLVEPGMTVIEAGAAGGIHTWVLSRSVGSTGVVHSFEPRPEAVRNLRRLQRLAGWRNVRVHGAALGAAPERATITIPRVATRAQVGPANVPGRSIEIDVTTVDRVVERFGLGRVDLLRVDVEGHEWDLFDGAERTLGRFRPPVVCEIEDRHLARHGRTAQSVLDRFAAQGYAAHVFHDGRLHPSPRATPAHNDYVLLPEGHPARVSA
jgi:FkbM family methyltransferase